MGDFGALVRCGFGAWLGVLMDKPRFLDAEQNRVDHNSHAIHDPLFLGLLADTVVVLGANCPCFRYARVSDSTQWDFVTTGPLLDFGDFVAVIERIWNA